MSPPLYLVTGATGTIGREIVAQLADKGMRVRALVRDAGKARRLGLRAELEVGDLRKPETLDAAVADARSAVILANGDDLDVLEANAMRAAAAAGVGHLVKVSRRHLDAEFTVGAAFARIHTESERLLKRLGTRWTIVRPALLASNFAMWLDRARDALLLPTGDGWDTPTDPRDVAAVIVQV